MNDRTKDRHIYLRGVGGQCVGCGHVEPFEGTCADCGENGHRAIHCQRTKETSCVWRSGCAAPIQCAAAGHCLSIPKDLADTQTEVRPSNLVARLDRIRARAHSLSAITCAGCSDWAHPLCCIASELDAVLSGMRTDETTAKCAKPDVHHPACNCLERERIRAALPKLEYSEHCGCCQRNKITVEVFRKRSSEEPSRCTDCGVLLVPQARHFSGCKSHPGEPAVKAK